jgi:hypothetical protein
MRYIIVPLIATILYFVSDQTKILMLDMIIASLKSDMAYLTQAIKQMDDKAKKKVEELLQVAEQNKLSIPENVRLFIDLYYQIHPTNKNLYRDR